MCLTLLNNPLVIPADLTFLMNMPRQGFYVPILPSMGTTTPSKHLPPYQAPEFWLLVNVLRKVMYRFKSCFPENYDLPQVGKDKALDKRVALFNKRKPGDKSMKKVQQIACLSRRCFAQVQRMAENPARCCRSHRITSYTFMFLKASTPEEEAYDLLEKVADGEKTIANLNKVRWEMLHSNDCSLFCFLSSKNGYYILRRR